MTGESPKDRTGQSCQLWGHTALLVQLLMAGLILLSLIYKRYREPASERRSWSVWLLDISKSILGQLFLHTSNVLIGSVVQGVNKRNACASYVLHILIDTTLGVFLIALCLRALDNFIILRYIKFRDQPYFQSGVYIDPIKKSWTCQFLVYLASLFCMKIIVLCLIFLLPFLLRFTEFLLNWIHNNDVQIILSMAVIPLVSASDIFVHVSDCT